MADVPIGLTTDEAHRCLGWFERDRRLDAASRVARCSKALGARIDLSIFTVLSSNGILMAALPVAIVAGLFAAAAALAFVLDGAKLALFHRLEVS